MDAAVTDTLIGRVVDGRYRIRRRIARGGMAVVFEAVDERLERPVALKVMHPDLAEDVGFVAKFMAEARSGSRLSRHPDFVTVYDQGATDGLVWIAMELVEGETLRGVLREKQSLTPADALSVMGPILNALAAAHSDGIVHRDVKPENVLVGTDGRVQLADLGLARAVETAPRTSTTREVLFGTVAYIAPELALGEAATPRSDVYAAGIMLYELLVGHPPHTGPTDYVIVRRHVDEDVPEPSQQNPDVPQVVDDLVVTATSRDPRERFADASAFQWALVRAASQVGPGANPADLLSTSTPADGADVPAAVPASDTRDLAVEPQASPPEQAPESSIPNRPPVTVPPKRRGRGWAFAMLVAVLLLAGGAATGAWYWAEGRWTEAPDLIGMTSEKAASVAASDGLRVETAPRDFSETVPVGRVITTDPGPGERVLREGTMTVVLSKGPERYNVPKVEGLALDEAISRLEKRNLQVGTVAEAYHETIPAGNVIAQELDQGTAVPPDTEVSLLVSKGREPIDVPSVVGSERSQAVAQLEDAGLGVEVTEQYSEQVPRGAVISQDPNGGTLFRDDTVTLVVSLGPEFVEVPDVEGMDSEEALQVLTEAGFEAREVVLLPAGPDNVLRQSPDGGEEVQSGSAVTIYVF